MQSKNISRGAPKAVAKLGARLAGFYNNLHFRGKMIISFVLFGFIPLLGVSLYQLVAVAHVMQEQVEEQAESALLEMVERVDDRMDLYNQIASTLAYDHQLSAYLFESYENLGEAIDFYHYIWGLSNNIIKNNPDIRFVTVYTPNPGLVTSAPFVIKLDSLKELSDYDLLKNAQVNPYMGGLRKVAKRGNYWTGPFDSGSESVFSISRVMLQFNLLYRSSGIVTLTTQTDSLRALIESPTGDSVNFIVDGQGVVVASSDSSMDGSVIDTLFAPEAWNTASAESKEVNIGDMSRLMARRLKCGWTLGTLVSMADVLEPTRKLIGMSVSIVLMGAVLSVALFSSASVLTSRRFNLLLAKMKASGAPQPGEPISGKDEIGMLDQGFREMLGNLNQAVKELYQAEYEKKAAELTALQSRINPHFLYNALSSIGWMTQTHTPKQVREIIDTLAAYYRSTLSGGKDVISLGEELEGLASYIYIQQLRVGGRIRAAIQVDRFLDDVKLPKMTLQPIVENSIEHGISNERPTVSILVTSQVEDDAVLIHVSDDGSGIDEATLAKIREGSTRSSSGGYGIYNVQMRLRLHFGEGYGLTVANQPEGGVRVTVRIPLEE
ncbi:MAG: sensor histidine kinase [Clostridiales bacterium]|jgi:two-component system sensor histidine kinase YesM|nr:sensor histidine kinase [Clostridiales bacterium]